jgi:hypothetical protein
MKMTVAATVSIIYPVLLVAGGVYAYLRSPETSGYRATVTLPVNHLVGTGDLVTSASQATSNAVQGKPTAPKLRGYTTQAVQAGQVIYQKNLESRPLVVPDAGQIAFSVEVDSKRVPSGEINAGKFMAVCDGDKIVAKQVRILAVICFENAPLCTAVLEAPAGGSDDLVALVQSAQPSQIKLVSAVHSTS